MATLPTFGFSAFLKLICSNDKPQKTAVRERHKPSNIGGYDYHRSLRTSIQKLASGSQDIREVLSSLSTIKKPSERRSAQRGVIRFTRWLETNPGKISFGMPVMIASSSALFRVRFDADCVVELDGRRTAVHVWNTKTPKLSRSPVMAALTLVQLSVAKELDFADDFAVLSLQDGQMYRWSDNQKGYIGAAEAMMRPIEQLCSLARSEFGWPSAEKPTDGPYLTA
jgi:hypothetical protein